MGSQIDIREEYQLVMPKVRPTEKYLNYYLEMTMGSQMDLKKEELMDSTMVWMIGVPREMHLDYHLEMTMRS